MVGGRSKFQRLGTGRMLAALVTLAVVCVVLPSTSAAAQEYQDPSFDCTADAGVVSWTDDAATKYWVYRSTDGGTSYQWIGRTIGSDGGPAPTSFADPRSAVGALYQVHYAGIPRNNCETVSEPNVRSCTVDAGVLSWTDDGVEKYWLYRSTDDGASYQWLGRTVGSDGGPAPTTFTDPNPSVGTRYQIHHAGAPRLDCVITREPTNATVREIDEGSVWGLSMARDANGDPVLAYANGGAGPFVIACEQSGCANGVASAAPADSFWVFSTAMTVGTDGNPVIVVYGSQPWTTYVIACSRPDCSDTAANVITPIGERSNSDRPSIAIGADGNPVIALWNDAYGYLKVLACSRPDCSDMTTNVITIVDSGRSGKSPSLAIGLDGNPVISYIDDNNRDLKVIACSQPDCAAVAQNTITRVDTESNAGFGTSLILDDDGNPIVAYYDSVGRNLRVLTCSQADCSDTGANSSTVVASGRFGEPAGQAAAMVMGVDGNPIIAHYETSGAVRLAVCLELACTEAVQETIDDSGSRYLAMAMGADGQPVVAYRSDETGALNVAVIDIAGIERGGAEPFACESDAGRLTWSNDRVNKYWVYRSIDGGVTYSWLGRTQGVPAATSFDDPAPMVGARYQVHYQGIPRVDCSITSEPGA